MRMICREVQELISPLLDHELEGRERSDVLKHLGECRACAARFASLTEVRAALHRMQDVPVPARLATQLQVAASKDRVRRLVRRTVWGWIANWAAYARLSLDNLMRPLAVPFAGGVFSAVVLFGTLVPTLAFQRTTGLDVPISLFTDPTLEDIGHSHITTDDTVLELTVDERGRVVNCSMPSGKLTPEMENDLLFYKFAPATAFGYPTWGRVTVTIRRTGGGSQIVVRG